MFDLPSIILGAALYGFILWIAKCGLSIIQSRLDRLAIRQSESCGAITGQIVRHAPTGRVGYCLGFASKHDFLFFGRLRRITCTPWVTFTPSLVARLAAADNPFDLGEAISSEKPESFQLRDIVRALPDEVASFKHQQEQ